MELDNLQIKITAETKEAVNALNKLKNALKGIDQYSQNNSFAILASNIRAFTKACSSSIPEIERLGDALSKVANVQARKLQSVAKAIRDLSKEAAEAATTALTISPRGAMTPYDASFAKTARGGFANSEGAQNYQYETEALNALTIAEYDAFDSTKNLNDMFGKKNKSLKEQTKLTFLDKEALRFLEKALRIISDTRLKQFKKRLDNSTKSVNLFNNSIMRVLKYRMIRTALKAIGDAYKEGLGNLYQYSKKLETLDTSGGVSQTLDQLTSVLLQLKNTLGVTFGYLAITFQPLITLMSNGLMKLAESINILIADALGEKTFYRAKYNLKEYMETANATTKANKGLLQSFDELHNITTNNDNTIDPADMFEQVEITKELKAAATGTIVEDVAKVGAAIAAYEGLKTIVKKIIGLFDDKNGKLDTQTEKTKVETEQVGFLAGAFALAYEAAKDLKDKLDELGKEKNPYPDPVPQPVLQSVEDLTEDAENATDKTKDLTTATEELNKKWTPVPVPVPTPVMENMDNAKKKVDALKDSKVELNKKWSPLSALVPDKVKTGIEDTTTKVNDLITALEKLSKLNVFGNSVEQKKSTSSAASGNFGISAYANPVELKSALGVSASTGSIPYKSYEVREAQTKAYTESRNQLLKDTGLDWFFSSEFKDAVEEGITKGLGNLNSALKRLLGSGASALPSLVPGFASGGFPSAGSLFWAGETNTPELIGTVSGRTAVAGGAEITGIREAIYDVGAELLTAIGESTPTIEGDMSKFLRVLKRSQYNEGLRVGTV